MQSNKCKQNKSKCKQTNSKCKTNTKKCKQTTCKEENQPGQLPYIQVTVRFSSNKKYFFSFSPKRPDWTLRTVSFLTVTTDLELLNFIESLVQKIPYNTYLIYRKRINKIIFYYTGAPFSMTSLQLHFSQKYIFCRIHDVFPTPFMYCTV